MLLSRRNGLYVVEDATDFASVDAALRDVDDRLFLTYEVERGRQVYRVMCEYAADKIALLCEWRDDRGRPLPLSHGLVEQVKSQRPRDGQVELDAWVKANAAKADRESGRIEGSMLEIADDLAPRISGRRRPVLHRGQHLRQARSRTRHHEDETRR